MTSAVDNLFEQMQTMPSIPKALQAVFDSLNDENSSINDVVEPLALDLTLSAKVLRMSNAAHFGLQKQVSTIEDAVRLVGFNAVSTMVLSSGLMGTFQDIPGLDLKDFWRKTLIASMIARDLSHHAGVNPEVAYTAALMHGIGILCIHRVMPELAQSIHEQCENETPQALTRSELNHLGFTHCQVGQALASAWKLPDAIGSAILCYAFPTNSAAPVLAAVVHAGVVLATDIENQVGPEDWGKHLSDEVLLKINLQRNAPELQPEEWEGIRESVDSLVS